MNNDDQVLILSKEDKTCHINFISITKHDSISTKPDILFINS